MIFLPTFKVSKLEYCAAVVHFHTAYFIQYPRKQKENPTFWTVRSVSSKILMMKKYWLMIKILHTDFLIFAWVRPYKDVFIKNWTKTVVTSLFWFNFLWISLYDKKIKSLNLIQKSDQIIYRTRATITCSWSETALEY